MVGARTLPSTAAGRASGIALAVCSMTTIQLGAALSEPLFDRVAPAGLVALRRLPTALFGVIMSLEPAIAGLMGFAILGQGLAASGVLAIAMVSVASAGAALTTDAEPPPPDEPVHPA